MPELKSKRKTKRKEEGRIEEDDIKQEAGGRKPEKNQISKKREAGLVMSLVLCMLEDPQHQLLVFEQFPELLATSDILVFETRTVVGGEGGGKRERVRTSKSERERSTVLWVSERETYLPT